MCVDAVGIRNGLPMDAMCIRYRFSMASCMHCEWLRIYTAWEADLVCALFGPLCGCCVEAVWLAHDGLCKG